MELLIPAFLPFNLIKGGLNAAITMLLYKPVVTALCRSSLIPDTSTAEKSKANVGVILVSLLIVISCVLFILAFNGVL